MTPRVFVTGAAGFLGRHIAQHMAQEGFAVAGIGHNSWRNAEWRSWGIDEWHSTSISLSSLRNLSQRTGEPSIIFHCAGSGSVAFSLTYPYEDFKRTVDTTAQVLEFARTLSEKPKVVYPSSAAVYGFSNVSPLVESMLPSPLSPYGAHKHMAELLCKNYARQWKIPIAIVRFFSLYGAGLCKQLLWDAACKARDNSFTFFGSGEEQRDWLHISDATKLMHLAARNASISAPVVNGGTGKGTAISEVLRFIGQSWPTPREPVFTGQAKAGDPVHLVAEPTLAAKWGFSPAVGLKQGLKQYLQWFCMEQGL